MHVLVAPDKFKGSLSAAAVSRCLATGLRAAGVRATELPLADGGDGSVDVAVTAGFTAYPITVAGATGLPVRARIAVRDDTALVEVASVCGLATTGRLSPLDSSSLGLGQAIRQAVRHRPARIVLALGGSASTDGGMGMLAALGVRWLDRAGHALRPGGRTLTEIAAADWSRAIDLGGIELLAASDVTNPLTGPDGTAAVYGPQKGATPADIAQLEAGLRNLVEVAAAHEQRALARGCPAAARAEGGRALLEAGAGAFGSGQGCLLASGAGGARALASAPGAGSAGGIGFAAELLGARIVPGAEFFLEMLEFDRRLAEADLVITGEGSLDAQSGQGKLPTAIARRARPVPVHAVVGRNRLSRTDWATAGFETVHALSDRTALDTYADPGLTAALLTEIGARIGRGLG
ncbi:glycerate kinase [Nocardia yamanashiensis]|uniref:glycerate kinase n=1 Tax=Nocardia yamanashiensis TaxID=209247 RepID=UPI001E567C4E|nr:glycerate kinase [Nocardia yamanashiensis]UGT42796.1 glycerate kinase [Nocardia yamanashiensis]